MNLKKVMAIGIALSIVAGSSASAFTSNQKLLQSLGQERAKSNKLATQISQEAGLQQLNDSDTVRVIVELEGEPVIEKATARGLKVSDMKASEVKGLQKKLLDNQASVQKKIKDKGVKFQLKHSFTNIANGFSVETTLGAAKTIEAIEGVKSVTIANEYQRPEPQMNNSGDITDTVPAWELGYTGEGTVVAILDSGLDPSHRDFTLTDPSKAELQSDEVANIAAENGLAGTYRTAKVPYGYNYMDNTQEIVDRNPRTGNHGMHVGGIVGANGDTENGGIKGTAPETQLLAMRVFGNNPDMGSTFGDVLVKAIDDSVILGADVINMSLGSTASFVDDKDPEQDAINRAAANGVVVSVSAGNSTAFGNGYSKPYAANPDYGVVGAPGLATDSLSVAALENNMMTGHAVEFKANDESKKYIYTPSGPNILDTLKGQELKVVYCGLGGSLSDFPAEVKGNVALVKRGSFNFVDKIANAEKAGAVAVIVYNHESGGEGLTGMFYPAGGTIPSLFMGNKGGEEIRANASKEGFTISFNGNPVSAPNPTVGQMLSYTSWGTTPDLEMKPEITGVGGNVWSTINDNKYQSMSGTSMAAPNVSGGAALVLERVDKEFNLTGEARAKMAKRIMMSTAVPHVDKGNFQQYAVVAGANYTSPRRQGAGVMNLYAAATTPAVVTNSDTNECKVNLKEIKGDKAIFNITVENFSDKEVVYQLGGTVQTDLSDGEYDYLQAQNLIDKNTGKFPMSFSKNEVTVPAKSKTEVTVTVDLSNAVTAFGQVALEEAFPNGGFVEGFVTLTDPTDTNAQLNIPYMGFKGAWDKAPALDASIYDTDRLSFYGITSMASHVGNGYYNYLGMAYDGNTDASTIAFSPNGDASYDTVTPILSYLRNIKELKLEILDAKGNVIRNLNEDFKLTKHYFDNNGSKYTINEQYTWDGKANNKLVKDGDYTYRVKALIDYENAQWQTYDFPVKVDTVAPTVNNSEIVFDEANNTLTVKAMDNNLIHRYALVENGNIIAESGNGVLTPETPINKNCHVEVYDFAGNKTIVKLYNVLREDGKKPEKDKGDNGEGITPEVPSQGQYKEPTGIVAGDKTAPVVKVENPQFFWMYTENTINVKGTVTDASAIDVVTINGQQMPLTFNTEKGYWEFAVDMYFEDGYHSLQVYSRDKAGNEITYAQKIFVDTKAPVVNVNEIPKVTSADSIVLKGLITDNLPNLKVRVNGNVVKTIANSWEYFASLPSASYDLNYEVKLEKGRNKIVVEAVDDVGNTTVKEFYINRK